MLVESLPGPDMMYHLPAYNINSFDGALPKF